MATLIRDPMLISQTRLRLPDFLFFLPARRRGEEGRRGFLFPASGRLSFAIVSALLKPARLSDQKDGPGYHFQSFLLYFSN